MCILEGKGYNLVCGIAGKLSWNISPSSSAVSGMCDKLAHRGPDDRGIVDLQNISLGHTRLAIIDLSENASQPIASKDKRYYIVYNGEVYNFKKIRQELEILGIDFKTKSDTEVVLYSYIKWGTECLDKFDGMFAFAIWDNYANELFLARDRFGKKPLYYYIEEAKRIIFASELTALISDKDVPRKLSFEALNCYLALGYILSPMTYFENVFKLEPATFMLISDQGRKVKKARYWDYSEKFMIKTLNNEENIAVNILSLLDESVKKRMISDVPIGAFLSGGIDSSSVVAIMKKYQQGLLHTFSLGFSEKGYNEISDAGKSAKWIGTMHHDIICNLKNNRSVINDAVDVFDEPFADNSLIPMVELSKLASSYVKVVLSGDGADELFAGYQTYKADKYYSYFKPLPEAVKIILSFLAKIIPSKKAKKINWRYKQKQFFYGASHPPEKAHYLWRIIFHPEERIQILGEEYKDMVYDTDPFFIFNRYYDKVKHLHWLDKNLYVDAMTWLADDILVKVDRASMKSGIEVRCPYLDMDLASYTASIPPSIKMRGLHTKYILKKALKKILPDFILEKPKSGFNAPVGAWLDDNGVDEFKVFTKYVFDLKLNGYLK